MNMRLFLIVALVLVSAYGATQFFGASFVNQSASLSLGVTSGARAQLIERIITHYESAVLGLPIGFEERPEDHLELIAYDLDRDGDRDVIATLKLPEACGSAGCMTTIFLQDELSQFEPLNFRYAATQIEPLESVTNGMHDLRINNDANHRMEWSGTTYELKPIR